MGIATEISGKKLSITHYPNKRLKPIKDDEGNERYPLYYKAVFERNNLEARSKLADVVVTDEEFKEINTHPLVIKEQEIIEFVIRHRSSYGKLKRKDFYSEFDMLAVNLSQFLIEIISDTEKLSSYHPIFKKIPLQEIAVIKSLVEATHDLFLFDQNQFLTRFDWFLCGYNKKYTEFLIEERDYERDAAEEKTQSLTNVFINLTLVDILRKIDASKLLKLDFNTKPFLSYEASQNDGFPE